jgi:hypothetical protein
MKYLSLISFLVFPTLVFAWGDIGHRVVGQIAQNHLKPAALKKLGQIMGTETLARASTWADEIRSDPSLQTQDGQTVAHWHYVEIPDGQTYEQSTKNPQGNVYEALLKMQALLKNPQTPLTEKKRAIRWITHLVGDLHMPLHVGNGKDRGGNDCKVRWRERETNLHHVIDDEVIADLHLSYSELTEFLERKLKEQKERFDTGTAMDWIMESFQLRDTLYPSPRTYCQGGSAHVFDDNARMAYIFQVRPIIEKRLLQAGLRLAKIYNMLL